MALGTLLSLTGQMVPSRQCMSLLFVSFLCSTSSTMTLFLHPSNNSAALRRAGPGKHIQGLLTEDTSGLQVNGDTIQLYLGVVGFECPRRRQTL